LLVETLERPARQVRGVVFGVDHLDQQRRHMRVLEDAAVSPLGQHLRAGQIQRAEYRSVAAVGHGLRVGWFVLHNEVAAVLGYRAIVEAMPYLRNWDWWHAAERRLRRLA